MRTETATEHVRFFWYNGIFFAHCQFEVFRTAVKRGRGEGSSLNKYYHGLVEHHITGCLATSSSSSTSKHHLWPNIVQTAAHKEKSQKIHHIYKWSLVVWSFSSSTTLNPSPQRSPQVGFGEGESKRRRGHTTWGEPTTLTTEAKMERYLSQHRPPTLTAQVQVEKG